MLADTLDIFGLTVKTGKDGGMRTKEEVKEILRREFGDIYCYNCANQGTDRCDWCHRKAMAWKPSEEFVEDVAEDICK